MASRLVNHARGCAIARPVSPGAGLLPTGHEIDARFTIAGPAGPSAGLLASWTCTPTSSWSSANAAHRRYRSAPRKYACRPGRSHTSTRPFRVAVATMDHRVRGDDGLTVVARRHRDRFRFGRSPVGGVTGPGAVEYTPNTCLVMCIPTPLTSPSAPGSCPEPLDHRRDRVREIPARRTTVIREPAGDGEAASVGRVDARARRPRSATSSGSTSRDRSARRRRRPRPRRASACALAARHRGRRREIGMRGDERRDRSRRTSRGDTRADRQAHRARRRARGWRESEPPPCRRPSPRPCISCTGSRPSGCRRAGATISAAVARRAGTRRADSRPRPRSSARASRPMPSR